MKNFQTIAPIWGIIKLTALVVATMIALSGCKDDDDGYIPVANISGVPTSAEANSPLVLTATVSPSNATSQTIVWSIKDAGTTGASITGGNTLTATEAGTVIITATITNGATANTPFTNDFTVSVTTLEGQIEALYQEIKPLADAILLSENPDWTALAEQYKGRKEIKEIDVDERTLAIEFVNGKIKGWLNPPLPLSDDIEVLSSNIDLKILNLPVNLKNSSLSGKPRMLIIDCLSDQWQFSYISSVVSRIYYLFKDLWDVDYAKNADLDFFGNYLDQYDVVAILCHGTNPEKIGSFIITGEKVPLTGEKLSRSPIEITVRENSGTTIASVSKQNYYAIGVDFINENYKDNSFNQSFIYLGSCWGLARPEQLADHFIKKGAKVVVGWDNTQTKPAEPFEKILELLLDNIDLNEVFSKLPNEYKEDRIGDIFFLPVWARLNYYPQSGGNYKLPTPPPSGNNTITLITAIDVRYDWGREMIGLTGDGTASVNWGDGTIETKSIESLTVFTSPYYNYTNPHTITITGNNIRYLDCYHSNFASIDISGLTSLTEFLGYSHPPLKSLNASGCTALTSIYINTTQCSNLDVSGCTALIELSCLYSALTSINVSGCTALSALGITGNHLSATALNAMFETLHSNSVSGMYQKSVRIHCNPGSWTCDRSIAENKGWSVQYSMCRPGETRP